MRLVDPDTNEPIGIPYRNECLIRPTEAESSTSSRTQRSDPSLKEEADKLLAIDDAIDRAFDEMCQEQWPIIVAELGEGVPYTTVTEKNKLRDILITIEEVNPERYTEVSLEDKKSRYKVMVPEDEE